MYIGQITFYCLSCLSGKHGIFYKKISPFPAAYLRKAFSFNMYIFISSARLLSNSEFPICTSNLKKNLFDISSSNDFNPIRWCCSIININLMCSAVRLWKLRLQYDIKVQNTQNNFEVFFNPSVVYTKTDTHHLPNQKIHLLS